MVELADVRLECLNNTNFDTGSFYGPADELSLGTGLIYYNVAYPVLNTVDQIFDTVRGPVLVLSHECDVDANNIRYFNDYVICCPIIPLEAFTEDMKRRHLEGDLLRLARDVATNRITRLMYFPPFPELAHGGFIYLSHMCSTHVSLFVAPARKTIALTAVSIRYLDEKLYNSLLRPKDEFLPLARFVGR